MNDCENMTVTEFNLTPFSTSRINEIIIFSGFLFMYLLAVVGNLIIIVLVCSTPQLHTPMYFFLCNLSFVDIIYVSAILPKLLFISMTENTTISFIGCMTQLFFFVLCAFSDNYILACMAYDRYVAICSPLHYSMIMTRKVCFIIIASYMIFCSVNALIFTIMVSTLSFCYSHKINHFFCELMPLIALSSNVTERMRIFISVENIFVAINLIFILISYVRIVSTVVKIRSSRGQLKAFSSCSSHIITVLLFYTPGIIIYVKPQSGNSKEQNKILSMLYVAVVPMLSPVVYSLRNKEVLGAARKTGKVIWKRIVLSSF